MKKRKKQKPTTGCPQGIHSGKEGTVVFSWCDQVEVFGWRMLRTRQQILCTLYSTQYFKGHWSMCRFCCLHPLCLSLRVRKGRRPGVVLHACNPSYLGGWYRMIMSSRAAETTESKGQPGKLKIQSKNNTKRTKAGTQWQSSGLVCTVPWFHYQHSNRQNHRKR